MHSISPEESSILAPDENSIIDLYVTVTKSDERDGQFLLGLLWSLMFQPSLNYNGTEKQLSILEQNFQEK